MVEVPGVENEDQVRDLVGSTGQLQFIDPQGQQLTEGQDISGLIDRWNREGAVRRRPDRPGERGAELDRTASWA